MKLEVNFQSIKKGVSLENQLIFMDKFQNKVSDEEYP